MPDVSNTRVDWMYSDASNYKQHSSVVLPGVPDPADLARLQTLVDNGEAFLPGQVGLEPLYGQNESHYDDDHIWHELTEIRITDQVADRTDLTAAAFAAQFNGIVWDETPAATALEDWKAETPHGPLDEDHEDCPCEHHTDPSAPAGEPTPPALPGS